MIEAGACSSTLRALGGFLERVDATEIGIIDHDEYIEVSWRNRRGGREERYHDAVELGALRISAELYRGAEDGSGRVGLSELLRTLGQELDELSVEGVAIAATRDGFFATGRSKSGEISRTYLQSELIARTQAYRRARAAKSKQT